MKITSNIGKYYNKIVDIAYEKYIEEASNVGEAYVESEYRGKK